MPDAVKTSAEKLRGLTSANSASSRLSVPDIPLTPMSEELTDRLPDLGQWNDTAHADMQKWREQLIVALDKILSDTEKNTATSEEIIARLDTAEADIATLKTDVAALTVRVTNIETYLGL